MEIKLPENERALWILKTKGPLSVITLAKELNVTTEGARFNILKLASEGLVLSETVSKGRGRPQQIWSLTAIGNSRFPDTHADLTVKLIQKTREILGEKALDAVIEAHSAEIRNSYLNAVSGIDALEKRIQILTEIRNNEGYMAGYTQEDDHFLIYENHCPICAAATICQGFCQSELETFQAVLGEKTTIERLDHIVSGATRCTYKVSFKKNQ
ncbi:transcriptional regulator [Flavobacterium supellecticarium]|uniref:Transcriptional regulator n=1 Tax=Flavobacterium supellecticarium TaxID=2565924 RepID=A0A4S4A689_9FLAO|nr:metalloregulator ArsR/SmtB family transcription factor [Flavobacterium supellecticarium]THF53475.1 transcriptional regulator [Flavobacterium supellecticarium]